MKKLLLIAPIILASCSYFEMEDSRDNYYKYYDSKSAVDKLEYQELTTANAKNPPAEVNGHAVEAPKSSATPKNGVPLEAPVVN